MFICDTLLPFYVYHIEKEETTKPRSQMLSINVITKQNE